jgi:hypothetical protein
VTIEASRVKPNSIFIKKIIGYERNNIIYIISNKVSKFILLDKKNQPARPLRGRAELI